MFWLGDKLHKTLEEIGELTPDEMAGWEAFYVWKAQKEQEARDGK